MSQLNPFQMLRLEHLAPSPTNPRKHFDAVALAELAATIREHGVIEPIIVRFWPDEYDTPAGRADRPLYEIVAGERRYRASLLAEQAEIPALVRHLDTRQVLEMQVVENLQRRGAQDCRQAWARRPGRKAHHPSPRPPRATPSARPTVCSIDTLRTRISPGQVAAGSRNGSWSGC